MIDFNELSDLFKMFGDSTRVKIMTALMEREMSVGELAGTLNMTDSAVSHQLNTLKLRKLVKARREGKSIFYSLDDEHVHEIISCGIEHISEVKR